MNAQEIYKRRTMLLLVVTVTALVVCAAALILKRDAALPAQGDPEQTYVSYYISKPASSQENTGFEGSSRIEPSPSPNGTSSPAKEEEYLITIRDGKIGVFRHGESSPFLTADTDVYLLPEADVALLRKGIRVTGFSAVKGVLEDYE